MRFALIIVSFEVFISNDSSNNLGMSPIYSGSLVFYFAQFQFRTWHFSPPQEVTTVATLAAMLGILFDEISTYNYLQILLKSIDQRVWTSQSKGYLQIAFTLEGSDLLINKF